jgi:hypothetical protein
MSLAEWGIELYIAASERLFSLDDAGKLTGVAERDAPLLRDEHDWAAWRDWRESPYRQPFVDTARGSSSVGGNKNGAAEMAGAADEDGPRTAVAKGGGRTR